MKQAVLKIQAHHVWLVVMTVLAAFFASGYHHPDEYMQVIEFANLKLGGTTPDLLPWEYREQMRPWLLPTLFYLLAKVLQVFGLDNPLQAWSVFRLFCGTIGLFAYFRFANLVSSETTREWTKIFIIIGFVPWLITRGSSEVMGAVFFILGLTFLLQYDTTQNQYHVKANKSQLILASVLFGVSFLFRFHMAFALLGLALWFWIIKNDKQKINKTRVLMTGFFLSFVFGFLIDSWGYGNWTFSSWNYFEQNILHDKASQWGRSPFVAYLWKMQENVFAPVSLYFTLLYFILLRTQYRHLIFWITIPFIVAHSLVPHKEMRFLFFLAIVSPWWLLVSWKLKKWSLSEKQLKAFIIFNLVMGTIVSIWPSRTNMRLISWIHQNTSSWESLTIITDKDFFDLGDHQMTYLKPKNLTQFQVVDSVNMEMLKTIPNKKLVVLQDAKNRFLQSEQFGALTELCQVEWRAFPEWVEYYNIKGWMEKSSPFVVMVCR